MTFAITAPYAAVLTVLYVVLSLLVIRARTKTTITLGDKVTTACWRHRAAR